MGKRKNSTKAERKKLLKELGYTEKDMQRFWDDCVEINHSTISTLVRSGFNWTDLCIHQIAQLPTLKDSTLKARQEEAEKEVREKAKEDSCGGTFEDIMYNKIINNETLSEDELQDILGAMEIESAYGENRRWSRTVSSIVELKGKYFRIEWEEGLTESQVNTFPNQPVEVELVERVTVSTIRNWVKAGSADKNIIVDINKMIKVLKENGYLVKKE